MAKAGQWDPKGGRVPSKDIVVDQVRDVVDRRLAMKRFEGRRRFVILDPADAMNPQAQNALRRRSRSRRRRRPWCSSSSPDALLPTIRSRRLRVPFAPLPAAAVAARLEAAGRPAGEARLAAALSGGSLARALALDAETLAAEREAVLAAAALDPDDAVAWLAFAREHGDDREAAAERAARLAARRPRRSGGRSSSPWAISPTRPAAPAPLAGRGPAGAERSSGRRRRSARTRPRRSPSSACSSRWFTAAVGERRARRGAHLETCLADVRGGAPRPVHLFDGDAFLALRAAQPVALVPEAQRALNLVEPTPPPRPRRSPRSSPRGPVRRRQGRARASVPHVEGGRGGGVRARGSWWEGAQRDAARRLLALAAKAGWSAKDLAPGGLDHDARLATSSPRPRDAAFVESGRAVRGRARA